jgi:hypothetical protein
VVRERDKHESYGQAEFPLYKTDREIAPLVGVGEEKWRALARVWEREGFPLRDTEVANKRYWPACRAWLDAHNGLTTTLPGEPVGGDSDGKENWGEPGGPGQAMSARAYRVEPRLLTKRQAALFLGVSVGTFDQVCDAPPVELAPGRKALQRYYIRDLEQWIVERKDPAESAADPDMLLERLGSSTRRAFGLTPEHEESAAALLADRILNRPKRRQPPQARRPNRTR